VVSVLLYSDRTGSDVTGTFAIANGLQIGFARGSSPTFPTPIALQKPFWGWMGALPFLEAIANGVQMVCFGGRVRSMGESI
jgi:hypothetical protein